MRPRTKHAKVASRARDHHGLWPCRHPAHAGVVEGRARDHRDRQERRGVLAPAPGVRGPDDGRARVRPGRARGRRHQGGGRVPRGLERRQLQHPVGPRRARDVPRAQGDRADLRPDAGGHLRAPEHPDGLHHAMGREADDPHAHAPRRGDQGDPRGRGPVPDARGDPRSTSSASRSPRSTSRARSSSPGSTVEARGSSRSRRARSRRATTRPSWSRRTRSRALEELLQPTVEH